MVVFWWFGVSLVWYLVVCAVWLGYVSASFWWFFGVVLVVGSAILSGLVCRLLRCGFGLLVLVWMIGFLYGLRVFVGVLVICCSLVSCLIWFAFYGW